MTTLLVGTRKGFWSVTSDDARQTWSVDGPAFLGHIISHAVLDPRDRTTLLVGASTGHLGPTVFRSTDQGRTWTEASKPPAFASGDRLERSVKLVFWLTPGHADEPGVWYAGRFAAGFVPHRRRRRHVGALRRVERPSDVGDVVRVARGEHARRLDAPLGDRRPARRQPPVHRFVGGRRVREHRRRQRLEAAQRGSVTAFLPEIEPEFGHDPHCVRLHPLRPDRLYQQNHCGIYRMERPDGRWIRIGDNMPRDVGDIGFPIELHPRDPDTAWVFPMDGTDVWPRTSPDGRPGGVRHPRRGRDVDASRPRAAGARLVHGEAPGHDRRRR